MPKPFQDRAVRRPVRLAVIWIDWYAYHVARFRGLESAPELQGRIAGVELVGGVGVHAGLQFRESLPEDLRIETLLPEASWQTVSQHRLARLLWQQLDELDPEAVLVPGYYTLPGLAAAVWARAHGRRSILMTESTAYDHARIGWKEAGKGLLLRTLFDAAVTGGKAHVRYLEQLGFPRTRVGRFYDVVDNSGIAEKTTDLRSTDNGSMGNRTPFFLYVGRLAPEKNVATLLAAWIAYRDQGGSWPLTMVGDGPSAADLRAQAAASGWAEDVHFAGHRGSAELPPFYAGAGCFVLPSTREPWGLVVNEAMAASLPVLVSDRCGSAEDLVLEGENGFTFDPMDESRLTHLLHELSTMEQPAWQRMGQRSRDVVSAYSPQAFGREIASLLDG